MPAKWNCAFVQPVATVAGKTGSLHLRSTCTTVTAFHPDTRKGWITSQGQRSSFAGGQLSSVRILIHHGEHEHKRIRMCDPSPSTEDENDEGVVQGPSQAPTEAGVSTAGLSAKDAELIEACYAADVKRIEKALEDGADVNTADVNGRTSVHFCAGNGLNLLVEDLISRGASVDKQDLLGYTALHIAAGYAMPSSVKTLLQLGADANIAAYDSKLPVEIAEDLLEKTPKKRAIFLENEKHTRLAEIVKLLDDATELEEGEDGEDEDDEGVLTEEGIREKVEKVGDTTFTVRVKPPSTPAVSTTPSKTIATTTTTSDLEEKVEKVGDTTFTVKTKTPAPPSNASSNGSSSPTTDDIDVKVTIKEPGSPSS